VTEAGVDRTQLRSIGRYELFAVLGRGGMGTVYLGRLANAPLSDLVAIKVPHPHLLNTPASVMLEDEARVVANISDPHVVPLIALERTPDGLLMVMPYVRGPTASGLAKAVRRAGSLIPVPVAVRIVVDALAGLAAAHEAQGPDGTNLRVIHRDVSPQNLLVATDGVTRVLDFGVAKAAGRLQKTTQDGALKGKLAYMPPEQLHGAELGPTTDIYSATVVLWELLAGRALFMGASDADTFRRVLTGEIPLLAPERPDVPEALDRAIARGLAEQPRARCESARAMIALLSEATLPASADDVARVVEQFWGAELEQRETRVRTALAGSSTPQRLISIAPASPTPAIAFRTVDVPAEQAQPRAEAPQTRRRGPVFFGLSALAVVGALAFGMAMKRISLSQTPEATPSSRHEPPALYEPPALSALEPDARATASSEVPLPTSPSTPSATAHLKGSGSSTAHRPNATPPPPAAKQKDCDPPYTFDKTGRKIFRPECF